MLEKTEVNPAVCSVLILEFVLVTSSLIFIKMIMKEKIIKGKICQNIKDISLLTLIWETLKTWDIHVIFTADLHQSTDVWTDAVSGGTQHRIQTREEERWPGVLLSLNILLHLATPFSIRNVIKILYFILFRGSQRLEKTNWMYWNWHCLRTWQKQFYKREQ